MSKYNEVMENIVVTDEMRQRILENIEKECAGEIGCESKKAAFGEIDGDNKESSHEENNDDNKEPSITENSKDRTKASGKILKFVSRYGSKVAVFALVMLGAYGVVRVIGLNNTSSDTATMQEAATESAEMAEEAAYEEMDEATPYEETAETEAFDAAKSEESYGDYQDSAAFDNAIETEGAALEEEATENAYEGEAAAADSEDNFERNDALADSGDSLSILMAGDVLLHAPVAGAGEDENGDYSFDFLFDNTRAEIQAADLALVNQEVIIGGKELGVTGYPSFNAPYELGDALVNAGFDVICHATNHALDKGKKGIVNALEFWKTNYPDITVDGINDSKEEYNEVRIVEKNGIKVAILNYTYGTNGISLPSDMPYAVNLLEEDKVIADLQYAEENADFTIVCPHWGTEYSHGIDSSQKKWTDIFRKYGADLVIGTHPHVIEPVEMLEDGNSGITNNHGDGDMLVYYSIGNFVNWTSDSGKGIADRMVGGLANITLKRGESGEVVIGEYDIEAIVSHVESGFEGVTVYPLNEYTDTLAGKNEITLQDSAFSKNYCENLCDEVWGELWK